MKKLSLIILILATISCSKHDLFVNNTNTELPEWINAEDAKGEIGAVGIASPSKGGYKFQIQIAELDAKGNIAAKINSEISRVTKQALRSTNVNMTDDVEEFFSQATKEVVKDMPLAGAVRDKVYIAKDGTMFVHIILKEGAYDFFLKSAETTLQSRLRKSKLSRANIDESEKASKAIFDELEKERNDK